MEEVSMRNMRASRTESLSPTITPRETSTDHCRESVWKRLFGMQKQHKLAAGPNAIPGATGEQGQLTVRNIMSAEIISVAPETAVREVATVLARHRISSVPVVDAAARLVGIVSEGDLISRVEIGTEPRWPWWQVLFSDAIAAAKGYVRAHGRTARDVMSVNPITATPDEPLHRLTAHMAKKRLRRLPVVQNGRLVGVIARSDLIRQLANHAPTAVALRCDALQEGVMAQIRTLPSKLQVQVGNVDVCHGTATLYGSAASSAENRAVEVATENVPGVVAVRNRMHRTPHYI
jgi:CBS domain-containing protein